MKTYRKQNEIKTLLTDKHILNGRMKKEPKIDQKERKKKKNIKGKKKNENVQKTERNSSSIIRSLCMQLG